MQLISECSGIGKKRPVICLGNFHSNIMNQQRIISSKRRNVNNLCLHITMLTLYVQSRAEYCNKCWVNKSSPKVVERTCGFSARLGLGDSF